MATLVLKERLFAPGPVARRLGEALAVLRAYREVRRERSQLLALGERDLHDIGISRVDAVSAAERPLWREALARARGLS